MSNPHGGPHKRSLSATAKAKFKAVKGREETRKRKKGEWSERGERRRKEDRLRERAHLNVSDEKSCHPAWQQGYKCSMDQHSTAVCRQQS
jgi:hypothetical protein